MAYSQGHICHYLRRLLHLRRDCPLTISGDRRRTCGEFVNGVLTLAFGLFVSGLLRTGEVVAIVALNSDLYVEWMLAVTYVGGIVAPFNYRWSLEEAKSAMEVVKPVILVVDESCSSWDLPLDNILNLKSHIRLWTYIGDVEKMESIRKPLQGAQFDPICAADGVALICFTSGTTGQPKGVAISHNALVVQSLAKIAFVGYGEDDVYLHAAPLCHIGGISSCIATLMAGGCHVFVPKFDAELVSDTIEKQHVTALITVPAMMADLISFARKSCRSRGEAVNKILNGGGTLSKELIKGAIDAFPNAKLISAYGMTETCSSLTFMTILDPALRNFGGQAISKNICYNSPKQHYGICVGKQAPHIELKIKYNFSKENIDAPVVGSILTRGLHVMVGYWNQSKQTFNIDSSRWFDTGDVGWIDSHGNLWLVGRTKYQIKSGGENIHPEEVEAVLCQHPGLAAAVVIGIPDHRLYEKVVACVSINEKWNWVTDKSCSSVEVNKLSAEILQEHCRQKRLTGFKIPKVYIPWKKPFPLCSSGKLRREDFKREVMSYFRNPRSSL